MHHFFDFLPYYLFAISLAILHPTSTTSLRLNTTLFPNIHLIFAFLISLTLLFDSLYSGAVDVPKRPFAAIVGGSKVSSKISVIEAMLSKVLVCLH